MINNPGYLTNTQRTEIMLAIEGIRDGGRLEDFMGDDGVVILLLCLRDAIRDEVL